MKRLLQKLDNLGLLLLVAAAIYYSVTNLWDKWSLGLAIAGGVFILVGLVANYQQIVASLGKRSTKYEPTMCSPLCWSWPWFQG